MKEIEKRVYFTKEVSTSDCKMFEKFIKNRPEDIHTLSVFAKPAWELSFQNHRLIFSIFYDYMKETYGKEAIEKENLFQVKTKKNNPEAQSRFEAEHGKEAEKIIKTFKFRFL